MIRVDTEKGNIDLSKRKIDDEKIREIEARFKKGKQVLRFLQQFSRETGVALKDLYEKVVFKLQTPENHIFDVLQSSVFDIDQVFRGLALESEVLTLLKQRVQSFFTPQKVKLRALLKLTSTTPNGVLDIKEVLRQALKHQTEEFPLEVTLVAPPKYMVTTQTVKQKQGKEALKKALETMGEKARELGLCFEVLEMPSEELSNETSQTDKRSVHLDNAFEDSSEEEL